MKFEDYAAWVQQTPWPGKTPLPSKLYEEAGEVLEASKKVDEIFDGLENRYHLVSLSEAVEDLRLELGDNLCLIILVAQKYGVDLSSIWEANQEKLLNRTTYGKGNYGKRS